jgi:Peptidase C10 family
MKTLSPRTAVWSLLWCLVSQIGALATPLSQEQVSNAVLKDVAVRYPATSTTGQRFSTPFGYSQRIVKHVEQLTRSGNPVGYVVSLAPSGYYLMSIDDELPPWKLRADEGSFTNLPPGLITVLKTEMAEDLQALSDLHRVNKTPNPKFHAQWQAQFQTASATTNGPAATPNVAGVYLLTTTWNQGDPYNLDCPLATGNSGNDQAWAGCTACAVSQILRYNTQPRIVAQDHVDHDTSGACQGSFSISSAGMTPYDWADMPDAIDDNSPPAQQQAISQLMYQAAVALDSDFEGYDTGAAFALAVPNALQTYFGYSCGAFEWKSPTYSDPQWYSKIAADIEAQRPVFYVMLQADGSQGHAVVCDGYQNGNELHLNLGWGPGSANAWYNMDSVTPPPQYQQYTWTIHGAVFGITPPSPVISAVSPASLPPSASPQTLTISGVNFNFTGPNASTLVFYDPANNPTSVTPINTTATSMQAGITVGSATGTWQLKVVNGGVASPLYTFSVSSVNAQLIGLSVSGPPNVVQNSGGYQYTASAIMSDGSSPTVTPTWSVNSGAPASISASGQLTAYGVSGSTPITVSANYTYLGVTKTANYSVSILPSSTCGYSIQELINNGSFANGSSSWSLSGYFQADSRFSVCHSCPGYAYLANLDGSAGNNLSGTLSQTITIPANATSATLGYYYRITTTDSLTVAHDFLSLNLVLPGGTLVGLDTLDNTDANTSYSYHSFDITSHKGQTITVRFSGTTDSAGPTTFRVDDVSVQVDVPNPVTITLFGVSGPKSVPQGAAAQYNAIVVNCDNSIQSVSPSWSISSGPATISSSGLLNAQNVSADTASTVTANYNGWHLDYPITIVHVAPVFTSLAISGPSQINDNTSVQFTAAANYSDGSSQSATPTWSVTSGPGSVSTSGLLTLGELSASATTTVSASATIAGITETANQNVSVVHIVPSPSLTSLSLSGPSAVNGNATAQYAATAWFSDGSSQAVNPFWSVNSDAASISLYGLLSAGQVATNTTVTVTANYTVNDVIQSASTNVIVQFVQPTVLTATLVGNQMVLSWPTNLAGFTVQYTTNLPPVTWTSNPVTPVVLDGQNIVSNVLTGNAMFFRLVK